jgi:hypothetical protein
MMRFPLALAARVQIRSSPGVLVFCCAESVRCRVASPLAPSSELVRGRHPQSGNGIIM